MNYPHDKVAREKIRKRIKSSFVNKAAEQATLVGLTVRCSENRHRDCKNDGSSCLCACHDKEGEQDAQS